MPFDTNQLPYKTFRDILKTRSTPVVVWAGAGLSAPAGLPSWHTLFTKLLAQAEAKRRTLEQKAADRCNAHITLARDASSLWQAFFHIQEALGRTSYITAVRHEFERAYKAKIPDAYLDLWQLGIAGFVTLNIDRMVTRAFTVPFAGQTPLIEFCGMECASRPDVFRVGYPFVANLHGTLDNDQSWVFTQQEFATLNSSPGYRTFLQSLFSTRVVLFMGISADDQAAAGHLEEFSKQGTNLGGHYWLTDRFDGTTDSWAERTGILRIHYTTNAHGEVQEFLDDLKKYLPLDTTPIPVEPPIARERNFALPGPDQLERMSSNDIRIVLNKQAKRLLQSNAPDRLHKYETFLQQYEEAIYRAWSVSNSAGKGAFFDYSITRSIAKGAFGRVYEANAPDGQRVAIKILHVNVREEPLMLESFRRGVSSMSILSSRNVAGMVPYIAAWEIPAATVMELIEGPNLEEAVESGAVQEWSMRLKIAEDLARILLAAHSVPECVLHRDVRPANIMLKNYYILPDDWKVVVLDFDLSWHRNASEGSLNLSRSMNGYLAPEQVDSSRKKTTRNTLVDSYGVGMTLYYLLTGKHPAVGQHMYGSWRDTLKSSAQSARCATWTSLPIRFARIIEGCTRDVQTARWDMTRICGELGRLQSTLRGATYVQSAELFAEEVMVRSVDSKQTYTWNGEALAACCQLKSGFDVRVAGDEQKREVTAEIEWLHTGDRQFENVRKYIGPAATSAASQLRVGGWQVRAKDITASTCRLEARMSVRELAETGRLIAGSRALARALEALRLL